MYVMMVTNKSLIMSGSRNRFYIMLQQVALFFILIP